MHGISTVQNVFEVFCFFLPLSPVRNKLKLDYQHNFEECPLKKNQEKQQRQVGSLDIPLKKAYKF
jgi:hypothetical protein